MKSIGRKFALQLAIGVFLIMAAFGTVDILQRKAQDTAALQKKIEQGLANLAATMSKLLYNMRYEEAKDVAMSYLLDPDIVALKILEGDQVVHALGKDSDTMKIIDIPPDAPGIPNTETYRKIILNDNQPIGALEVVVSHRAIHQHIYQMILSMVGNLAIVIALETLLIFMLIRKNITQPLSTLVNIAQQIADGDVNIQTPNAASQDEIGVLTTAFGTMIARLNAILRELDGLIQAVRVGNLSVRGQAELFSGSWRELIAGINQVIEAFVAPFAQINQTLAHIAQGDLTETLRADYQGDFGSMIQQLQHMLAKLSEIAIHVKTAANDVAQKSREMSIVAGQMSEDASQQAAATEQVSASMEEMSATIRQSADNARIAEEMAVKSAEDAHAGKHAVAEIIQAMEIIADHISTIQKIAVQTNILSLNAAIEAAKAQDYGRGFNVVAASVRELAQQSRSVAEEIRVLVNSCVILSAEAGDVLERLVPNSEKTAELVQNISAASQEQALGVEHVNEAVQQMDMATQHNAATAEQVAATAENLAAQAEALQQTTAFFTVNEAHPTAQMEEEDLRQYIRKLEEELSVFRANAIRSSEPSTTPLVPVVPIQDSLSRKSGGKDQLDDEFERY